jgi:tartrate-resistant acid phosphatase type 5
MRDVHLVLGFVNFVPLVAGAALVDYTGSHSADAEEHDERVDFSLKLPGFRFIATGDTGKFGPELLSTTEAIRQRAHEEEVSFISLLGDLAYPAGFSCPSDPAFSDLITSAFAGIEMPIYPILGDNDYGDDGVGSDLSAYLQFGVLDHRWSMPQFYYHNIHRVHGISMCTVHIDTQSLVEIRFPEFRTDGEIYVLENQYEWLAETLGSPECQASDWIVVFGHHPLISTSRKGNKGTTSETLRRRLLDLFETHFVDAYFSGHDHDLQALTRTDSGEHSMSFIVSGSASRLRTKTFDGTLDGIDAWCVRDRIGFALVEVGEDEMKTHFIASDDPKKDLYVHVTHRHSREKIKTGKS